MGIAETLLLEFDQEMATTRRMLERTPEAQAGWKPHPKSMTLGELATHLATLPLWGVTTLTQTELDINPPGGPAFTMPRFESTATLLTLFDEHVQNARATIAAASDEAFGVPWTLKDDGVQVFTLPRVVVLRSFVMSHIIHHRGQYTVYLRLQDVPLPSSYGPTADTEG